MNKLRLESLRLGSGQPLRSRWAQPVNQRRRFDLPDMMAAFSVHGLTARAGKPVERS